MSVIPNPFGTSGSSSSTSFGTRLWIGGVDVGGGTWAPRAQLQSADDAAGISWSAAGPLVAPDVSGDPLAIGATWSASGLEIPAGVATANASLSQYWGWDLVGGGLALALDPAAILLLTTWLGLTATGGPHVAAALCASGGATPGVGGFTAGIRLPAGAQSALYAAGGAAWLYSGSNIDGVLASHVISASGFRAARIDRFNGATWDGVSTQTPSGSATSLYLHLLAVRSSVVAAPGTIDLAGAVQWQQA